MNETKIKAILFIIQYIDKELKSGTVHNYDRILYLEWRKKVNQDKLKTMKKDEIKEALINLISETMIIPESEIDENSNFKDDLGSDSLDDIELLVNTENEFNIQITDEEAEKIETVKDAIELIFKQLQDA